MATTDTTPMDVDALYQASQLPLPPDPVEAQRLWAANAADLAAAADEILRLQGRVERLEDELAEALEHIGVLVAAEERAERLEEALGRIADPAAEVAVMRKELKAALLPYEIARAALAPAEGRAGT